MEEKKSKKANVERLLSMWREAGLLISLLILVAAFTWSQKEPQLLKLESNLDIFDDEEIADITQEQERRRPPEPPPVIKIEEEELPEPEEQPDLSDLLPDEDYIPNLEDEFDDLEVKVEKIFTSVEQMPEPEGGIQAFYSWLGKNIKYPQAAKEMGLECNVFVKFVVEKDGSISGVQLQEGTEELCNEAFNQAAIDGIKRAPKWKPGRQAGATVRVYYRMPVFFKLSGN